MFRLRAAPMVFALTLLMCSASIAWAWSVNDVQFEDVTSTVGNTDTTAGTVTAGPPPPATKNQGQMWSVSECNGFAATAGSIAGKCKRTYTRAGGDGNYTASVNVSLYACINVGGAGTARGKAQAKKFDDEGYPYTTVECTADPPGEASDTPTWTYMLEDTTTIKIPCAAVSEASKNGPPAGSAYGYGSPWFTWSTP